MREVDRNFVINSLQDLLSGRIEIGRFCNSYENFMNFEFDANSASRTEIHSLKKLFDVVAWYSPFEDERLANPRLHGPSTVEEAARAAQRDLSISRSSE